MPPVARCLRRERTSAALGLRRRAEAFGGELLGDGDRADCGIERIVCRLRGVGLDLVLAQSGECRLGFCERALEDRGALDAASPRDPDRLRGSGDPPSAFELREPHLLLARHGPSAW